LISTPPLGWNPKGTALFLGQFNIEMMELTPLRYFSKDLRLPQEVGKPMRRIKSQEILA
jgi:hypothetical protein